MNQKLKVIPSDHIYAETFRSPSQRRIYLKASAMKKGVTNSEEAKNALFKAYRKDVEKRFPHVEPEAQIAFVCEIVEADAPYYKISLDPKRLDEAIDKKPLTVLPVVPETVPPTVPMPTPPSEPDVLPKSLGGSGDSPEDQADFAAAVVVSEPDDEDIDFNQLEDMAKFYEGFVDSDDLRKRYVELEEQFREERRENRSPELWDPSDVELLSIAAAFTLSQMESFKLYHQSYAMVGQRLLDHFRSVEARLNLTNLERIVILLKEKAGSRFSEVVDNDIPF